MNRDALISMLGAIHSQASATQQMCETAMRVLAAEDAPRLQCPHPEEARDYFGGMAGYYHCECGYTHGPEPKEETDGD